MADSDGVNEYDNEIQSVCKNMAPIDGKAQAQKSERRNERKQRAYA
jgi:hypothetical protein